ncbi:MAG: ATP-binding protein [Alphaproteobacteria bacterium]|nr:ATP-binding protein [Alphaproteobacteria bacterium]
MTMPGDGDASLASRLRRPRALLVAALARRHLAQGPLGGPLGGDEALALLRLEEQTPTLPAELAEGLQRSEAWRDVHGDDGTARARRAFGLDTREVDLLLLVAAVECAAGCARAAALLAGRDGAGLEAGVALEVLGVAPADPAVAGLLGDDGRLARAGLLAWAEAAPHRTPWSRRVLAPASGVVDELARVRPPAPHAAPRVRVVAPPGHGVAEARALAGAHHRVLEPGPELPRTLRDARWAGLVPVLHVPSDTPAASADEAQRLLARMPGPVVAVESAHGATLRLPGVEVVAVAPEPAEGRWARALADAGLDGGDPAALATRWPLLPAHEVSEACRRAGGVEGLPRAVAHLTAAAFDGLAECRVPRRTWEDLVLAPAVERRLRDLALLSRRRAAAAAAGLLPAGAPRGLRLLLAGPPGTGKSLAAEVLASALQLDLVRVDLAAIASRWVGESSKQLARVLEAGRLGTAVLLLDEGDALLGRRRAQAEGQDRYANQDVADLLVRLEHFEGVAVVTTNLLEAVDPAFLRRFTDVLELGRPGPAERARLWARCLPAPRDPQVDPALLGRWVQLSPADIVAVASDALAEAHARGERIDLHGLARAAAVRLRTARVPVSPASLGPLAAVLQAEPAPPTHPAPAVVPAPGADRLPAAP